MSLKLLEEVNEADYFEDVACYQVNGGPMWSGAQDDGLTPPEHHPESIHIDETTTPMAEADTMTPASNYGYDQQDNDNDLNNITPSLPLLQNLQPVLQAPENVDVKMFPPTTNTGPPDRRIFPGPYNFSVLINGANTIKKKFLYSTKVHRLYVDADIDFPINFSWEPGAPRPAYVRATVVFSDPDQGQHRVETCLHHKSRLAAKNYPEHQLSNVLHSSRSAGAVDVFYDGGPARWSSTVVQFAELRAHAYRFVCKNSCTGGINRRAIAILFTLEDHMCNVYGREEVSVRVCACPRRDMKSDEQHAPAQKRPRDPEPKVAKPRTKKIKMEVTDADDDKIVELPKNGHSQGTRNMRSRSPSPPLSPVLAEHILRGLTRRHQSGGEFRVRGVSAAVRLLQLAAELAAQHRRLAADPDQRAEDAAILADLEGMISDLKGKPAQ